jgi:hypothetical protein
MISLKEKLKQYLSIDKKSSSTLNIFTLNSPNKCVQKKLDEQKIKNYNKYAEFYLLLWAIHASIIGANAANGVANAAFLLTCDAVCLSLAIIWVICKYKFPNSQFYCYFGVIQYNFVGIWLNLVFRSMIPESLFHFEKNAFRDLYDFNRINFVITASLFMHDFKINALVLYPSFLIQTYFITDAEATLIDELG